MHAKQLVYTDNWTLNLIVTVCYTLHLLGIIIYAYTVVLRINGTPGKYDENWL